MDLHSLKKGGEQGECHIHPGIRPESICGKLQTYWAEEKR